MVFSEWPELGSDVIFYENVDNVEISLLYKVGDSSSNYLQVKHCVNADDSNTGVHRVFHIHHPVAQ